MAFCPRRGTYLLQVLSCERNHAQVLSLLDSMQRHVTSGQSNYAAVYTVNFTSAGGDGAKHGLVDAAADTPQSNSLQQTDGYLALTLLQADTTWRFDTFANRLSSPGLGWPVLGYLYGSRTFIDEDLIAVDLQTHSTDAGAGAALSPAALMLQVEVSCSKETEFVVIEIVKLLRESLPTWARQLLFKVDPANSSHSTPKHVILTEYNSSNSAKAIASSMDMKTLAQWSSGYGAAIVVRLLTLQGSASYEKVAAEDDVLGPPDEVSHKRKRDSESDKIP